MLRDAVYEQEDESGQELICTRWHFLGVFKRRHEVGGALGDAMKLVLWSFLGIHCPQLCMRTYA